MQHVHHAISITALPGHVKPKQESCESCYNSKRSALCFSHEKKILENDTGFYSTRFVSAPKLCQCAAWTMIRLLPPPGASEDSHPLAHHVLDRILRLQGYPLIALGIRLDELPDALYGRVGH